jgi:asparagine synthase (glutamine-hydrolysing)
MSGFIAIINTDGTSVDRTLLEKLTASLYFRGPDRQQVWVDGPVGLGHTLFRTTDEARHENQPASLDGKVWITGCIRIDAREDLLHKLGLQHAIRLADTPDSHLVLHAYHAWGEQCLNHLLGDFSFALWDSNEKKLFCARDRFGLRQLCYAHIGNTFIVSNSIYCIRQHPGVSDRLCKAAIGDFLLFGDHRWGDRSLTAFADIRTLEPAHCLVLHDGEPRTHRYWNVVTGVPLLRYRVESEYVDHFEQVFKTAVADRLRTGDIVVSLSGGMDSSSIAAVIRQLQQEQDPLIDLRATTVLHDSIHPGDERYYADQVSQYLQLSPHYIDGGAYPLLTPYVQTSCPLELYQPMLSLDTDRYDQTRGRVMLTGDGGDELLKFSSVRSALADSSLVPVLAMVYRMRLRYGVTPSLGTGLVTLKKRLLQRDRKAPLPYPSWINPDFEQELNLKQRWAEYWAEQHSAVSPRIRHPQIARAMLTPDWNTDDFYMNSGCTVMEQRCPFLDSRLVDLMMSVPALPWLFNKHLLRSLMADSLPPDVLRRPKTTLGFFHEAFLKQNGLKKIRPASATECYIDQNRLNALRATDLDASESYVNMRPLLLDTWLEALRPSMT